MLKWELGKSLVRHENVLKEEHKLPVDVRGSKTSVLKLSTDRQVRQGLCASRTMENVNYSATHSTKTGLLLRLTSLMLSFHWITFNQLIVHNSTTKTTTLMFSYTQSTTWSGTVRHLKALHEIKTLLGHLGPKQK